jgi:hypothetical protein
MLKDKYGVDTITGLPIWRIVWAQAQFEKRVDTFDDRDVEGNLIRQVTEMRECPKYQWIIDNYILERLVVIPESNIIEMAGRKISYELIFRFFDKNQNYLPPKFEVAEFVIETIYAAQYGTKNLRRRYLDDPDATTEKSLESKQKRVAEIQEYLWGDQSSLGGTTVTGESIIVPRNFERGM